MVFIRLLNPRLLIWTKNYLRFLAYRNDGYVDVYDNLNDRNYLDVSSAEKGLGTYSYTNFETYIFELNKGNLKVDIKWKDLNNRLISINLQEGVERSLHQSVGLDLLAPVGAGSSNSNYLPFFIMNDFDFSEQMAFPWK